ncbi:DNA replication and repair protein RecF-like [Ylistrum balloti]|uniref:DNA replication and repair protein RecF-like n=1 Tax=Ylistrum balloti TaxID=509963 RepID=UPI002905E6EE|nr:DNA replication and repair protein RecF-like [Ylistrum balloti]
MSDKGHIFCGFKHPKVEREIHWEKGSIAFIEDGDTISSRRFWAAKIPIFGYRPDDDLFFHEEPQHRRRYLNWLCSYLDLSYMDLVTHYEQTLKQRNAALRDQRTAEKEFLVWEQELANLGARLYHLRTDTVLRLCKQYARLWECMDCEPAFLRYVPGGSGDVLEIQKQLAIDRPKDIQRGWTRFGPHRDDLLIERYQRPIKDSGSQGYRKLAIILLSAACALTVTTKESKTHLFYLDDIEGELDDQNEVKLFKLLADQPFQLFLTAVRKPQVLINTRQENQLQWVEL